MLGPSNRARPEWWQSPATEAVLYATATRLVATFDLRACRFEPFPFDAQLPRIEPGRIVVPAAEPGIAPWSGAAGVELPVRYRRLTLGRFVLIPVSPTTGVGFSPSARAAAISMVSGLGAVAAAAMLAGAPETAPSSAAVWPAIGTVDPSRRD
jgi:hypothetical protein